jgi:hypothetical protein
VSDFEMLPIRKRVAGVTGFFAARSLKPKPSDQTIIPSTATATEQPGTFGANSVWTIARARSTLLDHDGASSAAAIRKDHVTARTLAVTMKNRRVADIEGAGRFAALVIIPSLLAGTTVRTQPIEAASESLPNAPRPLAPGQ